MYLKTVKSTLKQDIRIEYAKRETDHQNKDFIDYFRKKYFFELFLYVT